MRIISPPVQSPALNPQPPPARALSQAQHDIGIVCFEGTEELVPMKSHRENNLLEPASTRQLPENSPRNVIFELAVGAEAVDEEAHPDSVCQVIDRLDPCAPDRKGARMELINTGNHLFDPISKLLFIGHPGHVHELSYRFGTSYSPRSSRDARWQRLFAELAVQRRQFSE
jgi:hypothetical protein